MRDESGYTLIEMLTVLLIFGTVMGALISLFVAATNSEVQSNRRFQAQQNARLALDKLRREVHCSSTATVTTPPSTTPLTTAGAHVTLTLPNSACRGYPQVSWCAVSVATSRYALYRKMGTTCDSSGTKYVDYLTSNAFFTFTSATTEILSRITVRFPVNTKPSEGEEAYTLEDELTLRNSSRL
jgi:prepilin-type N-terminal cleavage/methylation domain-containing protein